MNFNEELGTKRSGLTDRRKVIVSQSEILIQSSFSVLKKLQEQTNSQT